MELLPAIDLRDGKVVRLFQGDYDQMTVYGQDPAAQAAAFARMGARQLHVVDLDGAREGRPVNLDSIRQILSVPGLQVEIGGGIRTEEAVARCLELGAARVILGTAAVRDFAFTARMAKKYQSRLAVGVDARDGYAAVNGWLEQSRERGPDLCARLRDAGVETVIYTDISRDGAQKGTNLEVYQELSALSGLKVIASGGISALSELEALGRMGVWGAILGKALYAGTLDLKQALALTQKEERS